ncbi:MAG: hypothetical protein IPG02_17745 [Ignavibacteria bacterium]|nr:hypothetical protein [Ignavibacteria bacterium]
MIVKVGQYPTISTSNTAYIIGTTDGGTSWDIQYRGDIGLYCINAIDNNTCYAGGADPEWVFCFFKDN